MMDACIEAVCLQSYACARRYTLLLFVGLNAKDWPAELACSSSKIRKGVH
jgi:hypothetical protein